MTTYVFRDGKCVEKHLAEPFEDFGISSPHVIRDEMAPTLHMANGKTYDSKSIFRKVTRDHHCIEVGDQANFGRHREPIKLSKAERVDHIKHAIHKLKNGER